MSNEDYKRQVWVLTNEKNTLQQHNERIEQRLNEYVTWSEQAQKVLDENKARISNLEQENSNLTGKVSQGTVAMSQNLLDENSATKRKLREMEEQFESLNELINPLITQNISNFDQSMKRKIKLALKKGNTEKRILALFVDDPSKIISIDDALKDTGLSRLECTNAMKSFVNQDFLREIKKDEYQTIHAVGDKVVSSKDLKRVTIDVLHKYIKDEISNTMDPKEQMKLLDDYCSELTRRGENEISKLVTGLRGDLRMARRSSDWIIEKLDEFTYQSNLATQTQDNIVPTSEIKSTSRHLSPSTSTSTGQPLNQLTEEIKTSDWSNLSNADVIDKIKLHITDKTSLNSVVFSLNKLRDHLESTVSGRALYNINTLINKLKKDNSFKKDEIHEILYELSFKV